MDIPQFAAKLAEYLAPFLPYLISAGETAAKKASEKFGEAAWNEAQTLWEKLKPKAEEKPLLKEAAEKVARKPEDKRVIGNLEVELEEAFNEDVPFAETVDEVYNSVVIGRDVNNSNILNNSNNNQIAGGNITNIYPPQPDAEAQKINKARDNY
ncbi:MAG: hypothetical protein LC108_03140, partial [Anaerolineales bacterium]|nr:hypothetical protein [Anaerolineales bacterium]